VTGMYPVDPNLCELYDKFSSVGFYAALYLLQELSKKVCMYQ